MKQSLLPLSKTHNKLPCLLYFESSDGRMLLVEEVFTTTLSSVGSSFSDRSGAADFEFERRYNVHCFTNLSQILEGNTLLLEGVTVIPIVKGLIVY
jgi:hypothetical protein